ncbi:hypothetical protein CYY_004240 [Polysphondylium violaceum]|uniref:DAGKc domain-containing protein n=1 Tax=Polysphondylium violaceum TaxID=133409 RepID=A0A8J4V0H2_9MYCE|nr:hypothetical protein CYY_004240 [Polysphondylium violaceum]
MSEVAIKFFNIFLKDKKKLDPERVKAKANKKMARSRSMEKVERIQDPNTEFIHHSTGDLSSHSEPAIVTLGGSNSEISDSSNSIENTNATSMGSNVTTTTTVSMASTQALQPDMSVSELDTSQGSSKSSPAGADSTINNRRSWSEQLDGDKENFVNEINESSVLSHPSFLEPSRVKRIRVSNVTIIYNPFSGSKVGEKIMNEAKKYFEVHGIKVKPIPTEYKGHAQELCQNLDITGVDVVCLIGGDGTIHEAVNGIMRRDPESREKFVMACLPAGTGNSFVLELQGKLTIKHVLERIVNGLTVPIDIAKVTVVAKEKITSECSRRREEYDLIKKRYAHINLDAPQLSSSQEAGKRTMQEYKTIRPDALMEYGSNLSSSDLLENEEDNSIYCFNSLHWGLGSKVNITAEKMRWMGKAVRYTTAALLELFKGEKILARIEYEDANGEVTALEDEFCLAIVNNIQGAAKGMKMAPKAKLNDGLIDLILIKSHKTFDLMAVFAKIYDGTHTDLDYVIYKQVRRFSITPFKKDKERKKRLRKEKKKIRAAIKAGREHSENPLEILKTECNTILSELEDQIDEEIIDIDGELKGQTPFVCEVIPRSVRVVV